MVEQLLATNHICFHSEQQTRFFDPNYDIPMATYNSGADGHYQNDNDRAAALLPILHKPSKVIGVANGGTSQAKHVTTLPF